MSPFSRMRKLLGILVFVAAAGLIYRCRTGAAPAFQRAPAPIACGLRCGTERWLVKTLSDPERDQVDMRAKRTSVAELAMLPRPDVLPETGRAPGAERSTFVVDAYLAGWDAEADGDIHLILADPKDQTITLIAEIPDPGCSGACSSGFAHAYAEARSVLEAGLARPNREDRPLRVEVTGVGFFDRNHGQTGAAPNFVELHPVLALRFLE
jgi:hypothetical protein